MSTETGTWFIPASFDEETAVLVKAPTTKLKALLSGVPLSFMVGTDCCYLCSGIRIYDVPEAPVCLYKVQRHEEEHAALYKIAKECRTRIFLYNELDICVAWSSIHLTQHDSKLLQDFIEKYGNFYCGSFTPRELAVLDSFCVAIDTNQKNSSTKEINIIEIPADHGAWTSNNIFFLGVNDTQKFVLEDRDEGAMLEKIVWASLESVFPMTLHKSPNVIIGAKIRELTDVIAFYEYGNFLIEAKDLSVLNEGMRRKRERRTKGVQKQARVAIEQLVGASKALKRGKKITDRQGNFLNLVTDKPFHCIVLLTEIMHEGDWSEVQEALWKACSETLDFYHVIDLRALITLLKLSDGKPHLFDYNLMQRFKRVREVRTIHVRSKAVA